MKTGIEKKTVRKEAARRLSLCGPQGDTAREALDIIGENREYGRV